MLGYTRLGYRVRNWLWSDADLDVDLSGRRFLITGANSGLGFATTMALAERGAAIEMVCRSEERGREAVARVKASVSGADLSLRRCDVSDLASVARLCDALGDTELDGLINNAGVLLDRCETSPQGHELAFATNVLGGFLLTRRLQGALRARGGRVIHVSSGGMYSQRLDLAMLQRKGSDQPYDGVAQYAQTKRAQVVLNEYWAERLAPEVQSHAMHPGWAATPGVARSLPRFDRVVGRLLRTSEQGADTIVWLAIRPADTLETGRFWFDRRPRRTHLLPGTRATPADRDGLWTLCEGLTAPWA